jgi:cell division protein ZapA (FtsZ GTPase activity inhibitor)
MVKTAAPEVTISGQKIVLKVPHGQSPERVTEIIALVEERLERVESRATKELPAHQVALLALLDLAGDYLSAKELTARFKSQVSERSEHLLRLLEESGRPDEFRSV